MSPPPITLRAGRVHRHQEHLVAMIRDGGSEHELARLAPADPAEPEAGGFTIQWLVTPRHHGEFEWLKAVRLSLDFLLLTKGEPLPWAYLCYHTTTAANVYAAESGGVIWRLMDTTAAVDRLLLDYGHGRLSKRTALARLLQLGTDPAHAAEMLAVCDGESDVVI